MWKSGHAGNSTLLEKRTRATPYVYMGTTEQVWTCSNSKRASLSFAHQRRNVRYRHNLRKGNETSFECCTGSGQQHQQAEGCLQVWRPCWPWSTYRRLQFGHQRQMAQLWRYPRQTSVLDLAAWQNKWGLPLWPCHHASISSHSSAI